MGNYTDQQILAAIEKLRPALPALLSAEQARQLDSRLAEILQSAAAPVSEPEAAARALEAVGGYSEAQEALVILLVRAAEESDSLRFMGDFQPAPGSAQPLPPGARMVCPVDPMHYSRRLRVAGQRLHCPEHEVELVPESAVGGE